MESMRNPLTHAHTLSNSCVRNGVSCSLLFLERMGISVQQKISENVGRRYSNTKVFFLSIFPSSIFFFSLFFILHISPINSVTYPFDLSIGVTECPHVFKFRYS